MYVITRTIPTTADLTAEWTAARAEAARTVQPIQPVEKPRMNTQTPPDTTTLAAEAAPAERSPLADVHAPSVLTHFPHLRHLFEPPAES